MTKSSRPVVVLSSKNNLVQIVACSTVAPEHPGPEHYQIPRQSMPKTDHFFGKDTWVKGDMIYSVAFHRLELVRLGKRSDRTYFTERLGKEQMNAIRRCVLHGRGMGFITAHIDK